MFFFIIEQIILIFHAPKDTVTTKTNANHNQEPQILFVQFFRSSASFSEPNKPFDGLNHKCTPEKYIQQIEGRVIFLLGIQPVTQQDSKSVRHFALKVQQLNEKGLCNEIDSIIILNYNENFTNGLLKNFEDFEKKTCEVYFYCSDLDRSVPFHNVVKLVDAQDIAIDKIFTHHITLEVNSITNNLQAQTLDTPQPQQLIFTQPRDPNNKNKPT